MFNCKCPNAKMSDGKLILSLPNAMTPVVWVMDMDEAGTFLMKVETTDNGLYVLQKISNDGKKIEDVAYYASKSKAIKAMGMIAKATNARLSGIKSLLSWVKSLLFIAACLGVLLFLAMLFFPKIERAVIGSSAQTQQQIQQNAPVAPAPMVETNPDAVGVPMSADDFLKKKGNSAFPF